MFDPATRYLHRMAGQHGPIALMYHSVQRGHGTPSWPWAVSLRRFEEHLDFLKGEGWRACTIHELLTRPKAATERTVAITFDDGFADNLCAFDALQKRQICATWFVVTNAIGKFPEWPDPGRPLGRMLAGPELRMLRAAGMEVGSHNNSHVRLTTVDDRTLTQGLAESKAILEDILAASVTSFAYPYGDWDPRCEKAVRVAGYDAACTTMTGVALRDDDPLRIRRLTVFNHDATGKLARKMGLASNDGGWRPALRYAGRRVLARAGLR